MSDAKQGGNISDMAVDGTSIPNDVGSQRTIPSVPRPGQTTQSANDPNDLGATDLSGAADNQSDIPRNPRDQAGNGEVLTATGHTVPSTVETKHLHQSANDDVAKGSQRYEKHARQKESDFDVFASDGPGVEQDVPGLEGRSAEEARGRVDGQ